MNILKQTSFKSHFDNGIQSKYVIKITHLLSYWNLYDTSMTEYAYKNKCCKYWKIIQTLALYWVFQNTEIFRIKLIFVPLWLNTTEIWDEFLLLITVKSVWD